MKPTPLYALLALLAAFAGPAYAQPTYWERSAKMERERDLNRVLEYNRTANKPFSPMVVDKQAVENMVEGWQRQKERYAEQAKERAAAYQQARSVADAAERAESSRRNDYLNAARARYSGTLPDDEREELFRVGYFSMVNSITPSTQYQNAAIVAYTAFNRDSATASFEDLRQLVGLVRGAFPTVARRCYQSLSRRFPAYRAAVEGDELLNLPYFFGALRPNLYPQLTAYPASQYEASSGAEKTALLDRFATLARQHPALAGPAAGLCRPHLNPYVLLADRWQRQGRADSAAACYFRALRTSHDPASRPTVATTNQRYWRSYADRRLRDVARWLVAQSPQQVRRLTPDDWLQISQAQALHVDLIAWAFRDDDFDPDDLDQAPYWRRFPALKQARSRAN